MITVEQYGDKELIIFTEDGSKIVTDFKPYFYVGDEAGDCISIFEEKCRKVVVNKPTDVRYEREKYSKHFEADIPYRERFMIDRIPTPIPKSKLHILYLDIETDMSIDAQNAPEPITCITVYSTKLEKYITFVWREDRCIEIREIDDNWDCYYYSTEQSMLKEFILLVKDINPHLFTGWNVESFDMCYIINRCIKLNVDEAGLSPLKKVYTNKYGDVRVVGRVVFDLLKGYKKLHQNLLPSYSLKAIAEREIQDFKLEIELENAWEKDLNKLLEYNKKDVELCKKIDEKVGVIDFFDERRREIGCLWENLWFSSGSHDIALLREAKQKGIILPSKEKRTRDKFQGAIVLQPKPGIYKNIICLDVKSLYPSIICQFNLSPETVEGNDIHLPNGVSLSTKKEGFIVEILKKYFKQRKHYKKLMHQYEPDSEGYKINFNKQWSYKIMLNSLYGYLGFVKARLFNFDVVKSIPHMARLVLLHMKAIAEQEGYEVIAGDTDSIYVEMKSDVMEENIKTGEYLVETINSSFNKFVQQFGCEKNDWLEVEFEKLNSRMFFGASDDKRKAAKKRYAYYEIWRDGKEVNKMGHIGFDLVRSDCAKVSAKITGRIFEMLLKEKKEKKEVMDFVREEKEKIKSMQYSLSEIATPKSITSDFQDYKVKTFHVKAAEWSNKYLGTEYGKGSKVKIIYGYIEGLPVCDAFAFKDEKLLEGRKIRINWKKQMKVLVDNKIDRIYSAMGWNSQGEQKGLNTWFN